mmetsp:Transcript_113992/g.317104  ORF Transcript_113992/g.317104 Transcript_113992/m.317104 type:complete len:222 (+) Transcript_113992:72-737(+)
MCRGITCLQVQAAPAEAFSTLGADAGAPKEKPKAAASLEALEAAILEELRQRSFVKSGISEPLPARAAAVDVCALAPPPGLSLVAPHVAALSPPPGLPPPSWSTSGSSSPWQQHSCGTSETGSTVDATEAPPSPLIAPAELQPEDLDESLAVAAAGVPSAGSVGHHLGLCKPCDFVDRGFCRAGAGCRFCHICGPEERRRRKLQRRKLARAERRADAQADE